MKTRVISAFVGMGILSVILLLYNTIFFNISITVISVVGIHEFLCATKYIDNKGISTISYLPSVIIPFVSIEYRDELLFLGVIYILALF